MSKEYGLIIPGEKKKTAPPIRPTPFLRPSIFTESSDDSDDTAAPNHLKAKAIAPMAEPGMMERRIARRVQEKALEEDPTVFQYDELYDEMETQREEEAQSKSKEPKQPKYIGRLKEFAERRKLENELRVERQVQKEREEEGEKFKHKESFVTTAYRKKLEEMRKLEEEGKRDEYLESIGDVTKQKDLDGFYRHLYEQKLGTARQVAKPVIPQSSGNDEEVAYKPIKSGKVQQRAYRKRRSSDDENDENQVAAIAAEVDAKKVHLTNNIDADSDFSIDSSTDDGTDDDGPKNKSDTYRAQIEKTVKRVPQVDQKKTALNFDKMRKETAVDANNSESEDKKSLVPPPPTLSRPHSSESLNLKPKRDKTEIWKKRTVGDIFETAVKRYCARKVERNA